MGIDYYKCFTCNEIYPDCSAGYCYVCDNSMCIKCTREKCIHFKLGNCAYFSMCCKHIPESGTEQAKLVEIVNLHFKFMNHFIPSYEYLHSLCTENKCMDCGSEKKCTDKIMNNYCEYKCCKCKNQEKKKEICKKCSDE